MGQPVIHVDAFTDRPFFGNPAAVCVMNGPADEAWMQQVAEEMNLAETAFLHPSDHGGFHLRWFTPAVEVDLCGHATLASAHVLWETGQLKADQAAQFHTRSGVLTAQRAKNWIELDFPATPAPMTGAPAELLEALRVSNAGAVQVARSRFDFLVELESQAAVKSLAPDMSELKKIPTRGVIVTARADSGSAAPDGTPFDFVSRFFAPQVGIDEDPVTGSAHCALGPWWQARLGKGQLLGHQISRRGGVVRVAVRGERIGLGGQAITVMRGELA